MPASGKKIKEGDILCWRNGSESKIHKPEHLSSFSGMHIKWRKELPPESCLLTYIQALCMCVYPFTKIHTVMVFKEQRDGSMVKVLVLVAKTGNLNLILSNHIIGGEKLFSRDVL